MERRHQFINTISKKDIEVEDVFSVRKKDPPKRFKTGFGFALVVTDSSGEIKVQYWGGNAEESEVRKKYDSIRESDIVHVKGTSGVFNDRVLININPGYGGCLEITRNDQYNIDDFIPCTDKDPNELMGLVTSCIEEMNDPFIKRLLQEILSKPDVLRAFMTAPASVSFHCAWKGGLLEHTVNVLHVCDYISKLYPELDRDLLLASAILHDIGKVKCYNITTTITESVDGRLKGHLVIGAQMIEDSCSAIPDFPIILRTKLVHMVLASHGSAEKGSPTEPSIPEALALNFADELDAKLERFIIAKQSGGPGDIFVFDPKTG